MLGEWRARRVRSGAGMPAAGDETVDAPVAVGSTRDSLN
jgi:hypothetical protein